MKKSMVAVGVVVALGVVWAGASWYTGKMIESHTDEAIAQLNAQLKKIAPLAALTVSPREYQRGVFSSHVQLVIKSQAGANASFLPEGKEIVLDETLRHGPFPGSIVPSMASVKTTLVNNDTTKQLFALTQGKSPVVVDTRISYSGDTDSGVTLEPLNYDKAPYKVAFAGGKFDVNVDKQGDKISSSGDLGGLQIDSVNEFDQKVGVAISGISASGETHISQFAERVGSQSLKAKGLKLNVEGKEMAQLGELSIAAKSEPTADGKHLAGQIDYALDDLQVQNQNLGSGKLSLAVSNLDGAALHKFREQYNQQVEALMAQPDVAENSDRYQQKLVETLAAGLPELLKGEPAIHISPLSWKNAKGESSFTLNLNFNDPAKNAEPQTLNQAADRYIKHLDSNLVIPLDMATELMTQVARIEGYQDDAATKLAEQQVKGLAAMGQMFRITTVKDNNITTSLDYANGEITLNGQKMPLSDFVGMFGLGGDIMPPMQDDNGTAPAVPAVPAQPEATPAQ
ncbi:YdgA family protein [Mangrovibacter sp. SLW1]